MNSKAKIMSSSSDSDSDSDGILTTKNVAVDFKSLEKKGAKLELSDDGENESPKKKKSKVQFNNASPSKKTPSFDAVSTASARSSASRFSMKSRISIESDKLSMQLFELGVIMNLDQFEMECKNKAEEQYKQLLTKFPKLVENRKRINEENRDDTRYNLGKEELFKMSRPQLIKENEKLRTRIKTMQKQLEELGNEYIKISSEISKLKGED